MSNLTEYEKILFSALLRKVDARLDSNQGLFMRDKPKTDLRPLIERYMDSKTFEINEHQRNIAMYFEKHFMRDCFSVLLADNMNALNFALYELDGVSQDEKDTLILTQENFKIDYDRVLQAFIQSPDRITLIDLKSVIENQAQFVQDKKNDGAPSFFLSEQRMRLLVMLDEVVAKLNALIALALPSTYQIRYVFFEPPLTVSIDANMRLLETMLPSTEGCRVS